MNPAPWEYFCSAVLMLFSIAGAAALSFAVYTLAVDAINAIAKATP